MLKKVVPHSVATALASMVLPVPATHTHTFHKFNVQILQCQDMRGAIERGSSIIPGGPYSSSPFQGERMPVNSWGYWEEGGGGGGTGQGESLRFNHCRV